MSGAALEFFFDPVCPWTWLTSRWVTNVQAEKDYSVDWRFVALYYLNLGHEPSEEMRLTHLGGLRCLRVLDEVRATEGNAAVAALYTALGTRIHVDGRSGELTGDSQSFIAEALTAAGLDPALAKHSHDGSHDAALRDELELALSRTGPNVGSPIVTFAPGQGEREGSFSGPVVSKSPRGAEAVKLWAAVETLATSGVAELKRAVRAEPDFT